MKQKKTMIIMVIILVALLAMYGGMKAWNSHSEKQKKAKEKEETVSLLDVKNLKAFSYESGDSKMSFSKEDGEWIYDADDGVRLNQSTIKSTAKEIAGLTAVRELKDPDEKSDYGLDKPDYTITYTAKDGSEGTIVIGDAAGDNYYAMTKNSDSVYTIAGTLVSDLTFDLSSLTENDTVPSISSGNLKKVEVTQNGETTTYKKKKERSQLAGGWGTISLTQCADYNVKDLAKYGLDEANRITVTATYKDSSSGDKKTCTIYVGSENGDNRYVQLKDSNMVYEVGSTIVKNMMTVDNSDSSSDTESADNTSSTENAE